MPQKLPPPPSFTSTNMEDFLRSLPSFNRWLLELTSVLANNGGIDPNAIDGYQALVAQVAADALAITALQASSGGQAVSIAVLQAQVGVLTTGLAAANASITTLSARGELLFGAGVPAAGLGKVNDWYGDTAGAAGARVFIKKAVGVWTAFPF